MKFIWTWFAVWLLATIPSLAFAQNPIIGGNAKLGGNAKVGGGAAVVLTYNTTSLAQAVYNASCAAGTTCATTVASTGAGNLGVIFAAASQAITSVSGGGTWVVPSGCMIAQFHTASCAYNLNLTGAATSITITWAASAAVNPRVSYREYSTIGTGWQLDTASSGGLATVYNSTASTTQSGPALTISGAGDVVIQGMDFNGGTPSNASSPYVDFIGGSYTAVVDSLNVPFTSAPAPVFTDSSSQTSIGAAMAFTALGGNAAPIYLAQYANTASVSGATTALTIPASLSGQGAVLIGGTNSPLISSVSDNISGTTGWVVPTQCQDGLISCAYKLSLAAGVTTVTVTWATSPSSGGASLRVYNDSLGGGFVLDTGSSGGLGAGTATSATPNGVALTIAGTNDVVVQGLKTNAGTSYPTAITSPFTDTYFTNTGATGFGVADSPNTNSGTAPQWTNAASATSWSSAVALTAH
jgi:hypothetical protein